MNIQVLIGGTDLTLQLIQDGFQIDDVLNQQTDVFTFYVRKYASVGFTPQVNNEVKVFDTISGAQLYGGVLVTVQESLESDNVLLYQCDCKDYSIEADRLIITERFENVSVDYIINFLNTNYLTGFTTNNVNCPVVLKSILFDGVYMSDVLKKLADLTNYSFYYDYAKDIHFFALNVELAPFNLTDTSDNYIYQTLTITRDMSQLRNSVQVRGGQEVGNSRTEHQNGDGVKKQFVTANFFSSLPVVTVDGSTYTVGIDFVDVEANFQAFWNKDQKYIRFNDSWIPDSGTNNISFTGTPLYDIVVEVTDDSSILTYGEYEMVKVDKTISSRADAITFAQSELKAYAQALREGSFDTYTPGLRSGQVISLNSTIRGISESYLIQQVTFTLDTPTRGHWAVQFATLKTIGIIQFLQSLLQTDSITENDTTTILKFIQLKDTATLLDSVSTLAKRGSIYYVAPANPANDLPLTYNYAHTNMSVVTH